MLQEKTRRAAAAARIAAMMDSTPSQPTQYTEEYSLYSDEEPAEPEPEPQYTTVSYRIPGQYSPWRLNCL